MGWWIFSLKIFTGEGARVNVRVRGCCRVRVLELSSTNEYTAIR
jgi:hypothetical protein